MVSTIAAGDTRPYVDVSDIVMMPSVVDVAGINRLSARRSSPMPPRAIVGMVTAAPPLAIAERPLVAATMFGVTTPCVDRARGCARGSRLRGPRLPRDRDRRPDDGGPDPRRLHRRRPRHHHDRARRRARRRRAQRRPATGSRPRASAGIPQVVSAGALDMVNFGAPETVPDEIHGTGPSIRHNPQVTLMRTTARGERAPRPDRRREAQPREGADDLRDAEAGCVADRHGGKALLRSRAPTPPSSRALKANLGKNVSLVEIDTDINDETFATRWRRRLLIAELKKGPSALRLPSTARRTRRRSPARG